MPSELGLYIPEKQVAICLNSKGALDKLGGGGQGQVKKCADQIC